MFQIANNFGEYFDKLLDMFTKVGDALPRFRTYEMLFPTHERLVQALSVVYVDIVTFCIEAKKVFRDASKPICL
jgi:hypothetical protein